MFGKKGAINVKDETMTYIANGMKIDGKLRCTGPIQIDGEVEGDIDCQNEVSVGPSARVVATINTAKALVNGRVEGNLFTSEQLEVLAQGHIIGNVSNPPGKLIIHEGAVIEGQCFTSDASKKLVLEKPTADEKSLPAQEKKLLNSPPQPNKEADQKSWSKSEAPPSP